MSLFNTSFIIADILKKATVMVSKAKIIFISALTIFSVIIEMLTELADSFKHLRPDCLATTLHEYSAHVHSYDVKWADNDDNRVVNDKNGEYGNQDKA